MFSKSSRTTAFFAATLVAASASIATAVEPVKLRWASDHPGPPHPAGIAEVYFAEQVEKKIPGSKVQIFWAKSLYTIPQGVKRSFEFSKTGSIWPTANLLRVEVIHVSTHTTFLEIKSRNS